MSDNRDFSLQDFTRSLINLRSLNNVLTMYFFEGFDKASEETDFSYKNCCNDETGESYY